MKLVIDRKTWLRGEGSKPSRLYRPSDGKMCCLGFLGCQVGVTKDQMFDREEPTSTLFNSKKSIWPEWLMKDDEVLYGLMQVNDTIMMSEEMRETELSKMFALHGIEVEFVGDTGDKS